MTLDQITSPTRPGLRAPFGVTTADGTRWRCATEGIMLVALRGDAPDVEGAPVAQVAGWIDDPLPFVPAPTLRAFAGEAVWETACAECDGAGKTRECADCDGTGSSSRECDECGDEHDCDCKTCDGTGEGDTEAPCEDCGGTGRRTDLTGDVSEHAVEVAGIVIDRRRLARVLALLPDGAEPQVAPVGDYVLALSATGYRARISAMCCEPRDRWTP